jgi:hypothetical protein
MLQGHPSLLKNSLGSRFHTRLGTKYAVLGRFRALFVVATSLKSTFSTRWVVFEANKEFPASKLPGTRRAHSLREIFHAMFSVFNSGCPRRLGTSLPLVNARDWGERPQGPIAESNDLRSLGGPRHTP